MAYQTSEHVEGDPHDLERFVRAQTQHYEQALAEIRSGRKRSHWMWFIFPQCEGLGSSPMSSRYSIKSRAEAKAYLNHPLLGPRLVTSMNAVLEVEGRSASELFGSPDDMKLQSCATLFACLSTAGSVFHQLLRKYFGDRRDANTLRLMGLES
jgi:uncharacterized protein (DUF1810 family)